jgi:hypothetical protein
VWAPRTAQEYDNSTGRVAGAVVPLDMTRTSWTSSRVAMLEAKQKPGFDALAWERAALHEIAQSISGPYAEARFEENGDPWWSYAAFDHIMDASKGDDLLGAKMDMLHAAQVMNDFRTDKVGGRLLVDAAAEVRDLWNRPDVWACVTRIAHLLRERGKLTYVEVATDLGLAV